MSAYGVISPVRDEERFLAQTVRCMVSQSVRPIQWVLVDDGSSDRTGQIIEAAAAEHSWIKPIHRKDRGRRVAGSGVMEAFYDGYRSVTKIGWEFVVKLDGDLSFPNNYFEECLCRFNSDPRLGIGGGTICNEHNGFLEPESKVDPQFHVRGATKIYRRACWDQIGGLLCAPGWDTIDEVKANMLGWTTRTFGDLGLVHHRRAGEAYGQWSNHVKGGRGNYIAGYHPLFMFVKCFRRLFVKPYFIGGLALWAGFLDSYFKSIPQVPDKNVVEYLRRQQINRLLGKPCLWKLGQNQERNGNHERSLVA
jgi:biofilm PGA synthesis N-glycosyltransferase PgaC